MTTPREEQPADRAAVTPTVVTAPPRSRWRFGRVPSRLGRARTSTVVLVGLFVLLFALHSYLQATADTGYTTVTTESGQKVRVRTSDLSGAPSSSSTPAPSTTPPPTSTSAAPTTSGTPSPTPTPSSAPTTASTSTALRTGTTAPTTTTSGAPTRTTEPPSTTSVVPTTEPAPTS